AERLGVAPETISRWVNGALIQSRAMDNLLRLFFALPEVRDVLRGASQDPQLGAEVCARSSRAHDLVPGQTASDLGPQCPGTESERASAALGVGGRAGPARGGDRLCHGEPRPADQGRPGAGVEGAGGGGGGAGVVRRRGLSWFRNMECPFASPLPLGVLR